MNFFQIIFLSFASAELLFVTEISKEGLKTLPKVYPWSLQEEPNSLTKEGFDQHYQIGQKLKEKYHLLIHPYYTEEDIISKSCSSLSCISSSKAQLEGIYGKPYDFKINFTREVDDFLFKPQKACPRINWLLSYRLEHKAWKEVWGRILVHEKSLEKLVGDSIDMWNIYDLGSVLVSYKDREIPYPNEITKEEAETVIEAYYRFQDTLMFGSRDQGILATNEMMINLLRSLNHAVSKPHLLKQRLHIYVGDDAWYMAIMRILGMDYSPSSPASALFIELHRLGDDHRIRFWQKNSYIEVPECGLECDFREFDRIITKRNFKAEKQHRTLCFTLEEIKEFYWQKYLLMFFACMFFFLIFKYNTQLAVWIGKKFKQE
ncbi:unnamed protein product [Blepharisma stoltei]|uniref:Uncharacterized protein n=1 Tax=Blepharisma stoltei TaxID=1481888 RepID=A0AAU9IGK5_9CILI|nr:unnamed protein product [Blepharisma stoltei]